METLPFWRKIKLPSFVVEEDSIAIVTIMIPTLKKGWKRENLLKRMQEAAAEYPIYGENAQIILHPDIQRILTKQETEAARFSSAAESEPAVTSETLSDIISRMEWRLAENILGKTFCAKHPQAFPESVVLLLGDTLFLEEQMQRFMEMMQPYFSRINRLLILYPPEEKRDRGMSGNEEKTAENSEEITENGEEMTEEWRHETNRWEEVIAEYTDEIYYEYGLVVYVQQGSDRIIRQSSVRKAQGRALFLDYGYPETLPLRVVKVGDFYLDFFSSETKIALFRRKYMENSYSSPRKYLDTIVKSGYDKLVHQVLDQNSSTQ